MDKYEGIASSDHIFRYAQVLKSNGKVTESDAWLLKLKRLKEDDGRVVDLEDNSGYFTSYTNMPKRFIHIHNLSINTKYSDFGGFSQGGRFYFYSTRPTEKNKKMSMRRVCADQ